MVELLKKKKRSIILRNLTATYRRTHNMKQVLITLFTSLAVISCASKSVDTSAATATQSKVLTIRAAEVKDKGKKYDVIGLSLTNETEKNIIVLLNDLICYRGNVQGTVKHTFFNTGERTIDMGARQKKSFNIVCKLGEKVKAGDYRIVVARVYDNPSNDRRTTGKEIAKDVEWKLAHSTN